MVAFMVGPSIGGGFEEDVAVDKFIEAKFGQHSHALTLYKSRLHDALRNYQTEHMILTTVYNAPSPQKIRRIEDTSPHTFKAQLDFGYRKGRNCYILGIGRLGEIRTEWEWEDGERGYCVFDTYFADLTYRHYFSRQKIPRRGLELYGEGGAGLYLTRWRFMDDSVRWVVEWRRVSVRIDDEEVEMMWPVFLINPRVENTDLGWHLGCGFTYHFSPGFSINIGGRYRWVWMDGGWTYPEHFDPKLDPIDVVQPDIIPDEDRTYEHRYVFLFDVTRAHHRALELDLSGLSLNIGFNLQF
jgi:hypothetical protein